MRGGKKLCSQALFIPWNQDYLTFVNVVLIVGARNDEFLYMTM